jgi:hypothetical protein
MRLLVFTTVLITLLLSSCGIISTSAPAKNQSPTLEGNWTIRMTHSGGIMGLSRSIEITSDGTYTVADQRTGQRKEGKLSEDEFTQLTQLVASTQYSPSNQPSGCADCFIYNIEISGAAKTFTANADDVTLADSGLGPLVMQLRAIIDRELN